MASNCIETSETARSSAAFYYFIIIIIKVVVAVVVVVVVVVVAVLFVISIYVCGFKNTATLYTEPLQINTTISIDIITPEYDGIIT